MTSSCALGTRAARYMYIPFQCIPSFFWILRKSVFVMFYDLDPILCNVTGRYCWLLVNPATCIQHVYNSIARVDARKLQCIREQLGCLQASQEWRGNDVMDILGMVKKSINKSQFQFRNKCIKN